MDEKEKQFEEALIEASKPIQVSYLTCLITAVPDIDGVIKHLQFTVVQETESKKLRCYFDVVDPSKVKLAEE